MSSPKKPLSLDPFRYITPDSITSTPLKRSTLPFLPSPSEDIFSRFTRPRTAELLRGKKSSCGRCTQAVCTARHQARICRLLADAIDRLLEDYIRCQAANPLDTNCRVILNQAEVIQQDFENCVDRVNEGIQKAYDSTACFLCAEESGMMPLIFCRPDFDTTQPGNPMIEYIPYNNPMDPTGWQDGPDPEGELQM